jgi:glycosyltransferase involved in cell wall biosynthesis
MTVLIVHYHLRAGGVTRIIHAQAKALKLLGHRVIVASSGPVHEINAESILEPSLDYQATGNVNSEQLFAAQADCWIIHNPTLGKNVGFPGLIESASTAGVKILLQCHDFAEDGRPANYALLRNSPHLYPVAPHIHYALINRRDQQLLKDAGLPADQCRYLPNAITPPKVSAEKPNGTLVFYPVRGIRRKNLGELCLLAAHAPEGVKFAIALAPENLEWMAIHNQWAEFARDLNLPIEFNVVSDSDFPDWMARATHIVTTSVAEGFGLTFLEPAFLGKPLIGRNLPEITTDFPPYGTLYESLPVPVPHCRDHYTSSLSTCWETYGRPLAEEELASAWETFQASADFGNLPEESQMKIIRDHPLPYLRDWLENALEVKPAPIDLSRWSLEIYASRISKILDEIEDPGPVSWLAKEAVLEQFLRPSSFHYLRT